MVRRIRIDIPTQTLELLGDRGDLLQRYPVSSAANGVGETMDSECTPRGAHVIRARIGGDAAVNAVFVGRRPTGEIYDPQLRAKHPGRDWILTRILWLSGCEPGFNRLGNVDSMRRYIYIHGTPDDVVLGKPGSRGCIRMRNEDLVELFDAVEVGTPVQIDG
jgi:lipoprotein-anchoring transpeptidase ErfK/SrfK